MFTNKALLGLCAGESNEISLYINQMVRTHRHIQREQLVSLTFWIDKPMARVSVS